MDVDLKTPNLGFQFLIDNPNEIIVVDANFYLPPNRKRLGARSDYGFDVFSKIWIEPIHKCFPNMAIHEAVLLELVDGSSAKFAQGCIQADPCRLTLLKDSDLSRNQITLCRTKERLIAPTTKYSPDVDNKDDRGEVKSLAHMATVGYTYFASRDTKALRLIEEAEALGTTLDDLQVVRFYEGIYYLYKMGELAKEPARNLYRYLYCLTKNERATNPAWDVFCAGMDKLYTLPLPEKI